ncbi:hypothetical protein EJB05_14453, partial [Eragrostis curvula]
MTGVNSTVCPYDLVSSLDKTIEEKMWRTNALLVASAILAALVVGMGVCGQRYRHHHFTRFIFLGATTLFLPIISTVISEGTRFNDYIINQNGVFAILYTNWVTAKCDPNLHSIFVVIWASLVQIIMINTSTVVAVDDREGGNTGPPIEILVQGFWTSYLGISYIISLVMSDPRTSNIRASNIRGAIIIIGLEFIPFVLTCAKMVSKYYAYEKARKSFALGRSPCLTYGYLQQLKLQETNNHGEPSGAAGAPPPHLFVMGEETKHVEKNPHGYVIKDDSVTMLQNNNGLVTIERVWKLDTNLPISALNQLKDLCLSFALFKLLRCQFARYKVVNAGSNDTISFLWNLFLKDGEHDMVFSMISNELSFVHDCYYSSLPISYSIRWLPIVDIIISLLSTTYCIVLTVPVAWMLIVDMRMGSRDYQIRCGVSCITNRREISYLTKYKQYGNLHFDLVPTFLLFSLVMITEMRDMASYICSNWTKVALICRLMNRSSSGNFLHIRKWSALLLRCRCKLMKHQEEKMGQCSILELHPRSIPLALLWRLLTLPDQKRKAKVPGAIKVCIIRALRSCRNGHLSNGKTSLHRRSQVGESFLWACNNGKGTSDTILTWHIATSILEVRHPHQHDQEQSSLSFTDDKVAATHLSRYCAYLVTWCPELLPDYDAWSKSLYKAVKKDAKQALAGHSVAGSSTPPEAMYRKLTELLSANSKHEVVKNGVKLGKQLVEEINDEETAWKLLADFWSEMILYVAPSDNLKGHKEAIARGGELITLLWALLFHLGIVSRPGEDDGSASTSAGVV